MLRRILGYFRSDLAVDMGTANTRVGVAGRGLAIDEPSIVAVEAKSGRVCSNGCAVGRLARQMQGHTSESIAVVRPLADGAVADFDRCEAMLGYFLAKAVPPGMKLRPRVLAPVPGCITPVERRAVFNSLERAGAGEVLLMPAAKAAAVGAGLPLAEPLASMICCIGAGVTEVAVLTLADAVASQSARTGGEKMDRAIVSYLRRHYNLRIGLAAAEQLRIDVGSAYPLERELTDEVSGLDAVSGLPRKATVTSEEIRQALADPLEEILEAIKTTLDRCSPDLAADLVDQGLVLCGGGALVRGIDRYLNEQTGLPARLADDPLATVARGALVCLEHFGRWKANFETA